MIHRCPACQRPRRTGQYLCRRCWFALPDATRRRLNRADSGAYGRLRELHRQLGDGVPLGEIEVPP